MLLLLIAAMFEDNEEIVKNHQTNMTENKDKISDKDKEKKNEPEMEKEQEKQSQQQQLQTQIAQKEQQHKTEQHDRCPTHKDDYGTQRVYKKTSPNCVLTLYLPTREITLSGNSSSILQGIVFVDPKAIQGYRVYAQLTLTFRCPTHKDDYGTQRVYKKTSPNCV
ncbi:uncharacterized protein LOC119612848 isoform X2 [Lucilia sericata]|uniref:uncharacterized protein LOC119612848 isoform X2 n=1 Tax=Lucilia sericata TaxID=13632 RepID=UPI0018A85E6C|nr:uncharacterized protein LOC119612848 isoform X2 [Lucilia sericata]XP_037824651.1 uncharacterized protein LOC119612848 isoform X2 [Lucilia sericata]XP_037824652.1 uncharacterized protein LOC119612848 isoform X2 [Lucilia sericata]